MTISNTEIINKLVGTPFVFGGMDPVTGLDCWGLFKHYYSEYLGIDVTYDYGIPDGVTNRIVRAFAYATGHSGDWEALDEPEDSAAVALSIGNKVHHVGVWLSGGCLHAAKSGVVFNTLEQLRRNGFNTIEFYRCKK